METSAGPSAFSYIYDFYAKKYIKKTSTNTEMLTGALSFLYLLISKKFGSNAKSFYVTGEVKNKTMRKKKKNEKQYNMVLSL